MWLAGLAVASALADAGLQILQRWCSASIGEGLIADLRIALYAHVAVTRDVTGRSGQIFLSRVARIGSVVHDVDFVATRIERGGGVYVADRVARVSLRRVIGRLDIGRCDRVAGTEDRAAPSHVASGEAEASASATRCRRGAAEQRGRNGPATELVCAPHLKLPRHRVAASGRAKAARAPTSSRLRFPERAPAWPRCSQTVRPEEESKPARPRRPWRPGRRRARRARRSHLRARGRRCCRQARSHHLRRPPQRLHRA